MEGRERRLQDTIRMLYTNEQLKFYMLDLDPTGVDAREILRAIIERRLSQAIGSKDSQKIWVSPPTPHLLPGPRSPGSVADDDWPVYVPNGEYMEILKREREFPKEHYGNALVKVVSELPKNVRRRFAIPTILDLVERIMVEERKSLAEMQFAGYLNLNAWKYGHRPTRSMG
jgi:hypothetical protein